MTKAIRWTPEQLEAYKLRGQIPAPQPVALKTLPARSKYASQKVEKDGVTHDSKKEARRWDTLNIMLLAGEITDLRRQVSFVLAPAVRLDGEDRKKPAIRYFADFSYMRDGVMVVEDTKSRPTRKLASYRIKKHLMATVHGIYIKEV